MDHTVSSSGSPRLHKLMLGASLGLAVLGAVVVAVRALSTGEGSLVEPVVLMLMAGVGTIELLGGARLWWFARLTGVALSVLSLVGLVTGRELSTIDPDVTLGILVVCGVVYVSTAPLERSRIEGMAWIACYSVASTWLERPEMPVALARLMIGVVGQGVALGLVGRLLAAARRANAELVAAARFDAALARCSALLLADNGDEAMDAAIHELLEATDAGYVFVDVVGTDDQGRTTWTIIHSSENASAFAGPNQMHTGTYDELPGFLDALRAGRPGFVVVADLPPGGLRAGYEREGVTGEMAVPVLVEGRWIGSLGFSDFSGRSRWTPSEVALATRAAELIGAHWTRKRSLEGLQEINRAKARFVASVGHELRTPLAAVVGFAAELAERLGHLSPAEISELATLVHGQASELADLVADLLAVERAASGALTVIPSRVAVLDEVRRVAKSFGACAVRVEGVDETAWADPVKVRQIVRNLIGNALRAGGSRVEVRVATMAGDVLVTVSDDGEGVDLLQADRVFDHFFQGREARTSAGSVGVSLAVARRLAQLMGGDLGYRRGNGWTRFVLSLPAASGAAGPVIGSSAAAS